jgi:hypothetical protein
MILLLAPTASDIALGLLVKLCPDEFSLILRNSTDSGSWKLEGKTSSSRPRMGSGEGWAEEFVVRTAVSGDMMGEPCCEFEATDEALMADMGMGTGCV